MSSLTVIIANLMGAYENFIRLLSDRHPEAVALREDLLCEGDRAVFWGDGKTKLVISSIPLLREHLADVERATGCSIIENVSLSSSGDLCERLVEDQRVLEQVVQVASEFEAVDLIPWAATAGYAQAVSVLTNRGVKIRRSDLPVDGSLWLRRFLDSRAGFRQFFGQANIECKLPEGYICRSFHEARDVVRWFLRNKRSCVMKANFGLFGVGQAFFRYSEHDVESRWAALESGSDSMLIWQHDLIIVEEYIQPDWSLKSHTPCVEVFVPENGPVQILYVGGQLFRDAERIGIAIGTGVLSGSLASDLCRIGKAVGERAYSFGYRGVFRIDFLVDEAGRLYAIEVNPRQTGGSHAFWLGVSLLGRDFPGKACVLSLESCESSLSRPLDYAVVRDAISDLLFPMQDGSTGVVVSTANTMQRGWFSYMVLAGELEEALEISKRVTARIAPL